jgi:hypothetical protein
VRILRDTGGAKIDANKTIKTISSEEIEPRAFLGEIAAGPRAYCRIIS